jgi:hypothetical protein
MKTLRMCLPAAIFVAAVFAAEPAAPAPKVSVPNPFAPRFKQVRDRVDALFRLRNEPPAPPDIRTNPFRLPGSGNVAPATRPDEPPPTPAAVSNLSLLQDSMATLRVSGVFEISGRSHLVINGRPYKEGDVVQTQVRGEAVYLRVREISKHTVTLALHDAEMTLKF